MVIHFDHTLFLDCLRESCAFENHVEENFKIKGASDNGCVKRVKDLIENRKDHQSYTYDT